MASSIVNGGRGLLILSSKCNHLASRVKICLSSVKELTCQTLFVYLLRDKENSINDEPNKCQSFVGGNCQELTRNVGTLSHATRIIYAQATDTCPSVDVRFLFSNWDSQSAKPQQSVSKPLNLKAVEWVLAESSLSSQDTDQFLRQHLSDASVRDPSKQGQSLKVPNVDVVSIVAEPDVTDVSVPASEQNGTTASTDAVFSTVVLGGTFDRLHNGHKVLLTEAAIRCTSEIIVGVTDDSMVRKKVLYELIEPTDVRIESVKNFLQDIAPNLVHRVVPISDPFGPAIIDDFIELIVVSEETMRGANKINEIRKEKKFPTLLIHSIPIFEDTKRESEQEEDKISSSSQRIRLLGHRLAPPLKSPSLPYIIGLTGGIASGKTKLREYLEEVKGIPAIDCDKLGHEAYKCGTSCFDRIVAAFGTDIVNSDGEIDRRILGGKVFGNPEELKRLTDLVWPEIKRLAEERIEGFVRSGAKIIIVEAAVLVEAGWDALCHEIFVAFVPRDEAIARIQRRDNLPEDRAAQRVDSQISNIERLKKATFAFSSLWEVEFTRKQIEKALTEIQPIVDSITPNTESQENHL